MHQSNPADIARLQSTMKLLPEMQRRVLKMSFFEGLSPEEIASKIGVRVGEVSELQRQALASLGERMQQEGA